MEWRLDKAIRMAEAHGPQRITMTDTPNVNKMAKLTKLITMIGRFSRRIISISPR